MARRNRKRRLVRGVALIGAGGAVAAAIVKRLTADGVDQSFADQTRPTGAEQREGDAVPIRAPEATGEGTGSHTIDEGALTRSDPDALTPAPGTEEVVKPDDSKGDPLVEDQTRKAAAEGGSVGGNVDEMAAAEPGFPSDPEMRPVVEGSGDDPEAGEQVDAELGGNRETRP
jgi:hypothetical protein